MNKFFNGRRFARPANFVLRRRQDNCITAISRSRTNGNNTYLVCYKSWLLRATRAHLHDLDAISCAGARSMARRRVAGWTIVYSIEYWLKSHGGWEVRYFLYIRVCNKILVLNHACLPAKVFPNFINIALDFSEISSKLFWVGIALILECHISADFCFCT